MTKQAIDGWNQRIRVDWVRRLALLVTIASGLVKPSCCQSFDSFRPDSPEQSHPDERNGRTKEKDSDVSAQRNDGHPLFRQNQLFIAELSPSLQALRIFQTEPQEPRDKGATLSAEEGEHRLLGPAPAPLERRAQFAFDSGEFEFGKINPPTNDPFNSFAGFDSTGSPTPAPATGRSSTGPPVSDGTELPTKPPAPAADHTAPSIAPVDRSTDSPDSTVQESPAPSPPSTGSPLSTGANVGANIDKTMAPSPAESSSHQGLLSSAQPSPGPDHVTGTQGPTNTNMSPSGMTTIAPSEGSDPRFVVPTATPTRKYHFDPIPPPSTTMPTQRPTPAPVTLLVTLVPTTVLLKEQHEIDDLSRDKKLQISLAVISIFLLGLFIFVAQQVFENPDGCCARCCKCMIAVYRILFWPCRLMLGWTNHGGGGNNINNKNSPRSRRRRGHNNVATDDPDFDADDSHMYSSDLELT